MFHGRKMKLRKSHYGLKFGGMKQFTMKRIAVLNGHAQLMFAWSDRGSPRVLSLFEHLVFYCSYVLDHRTTINFYTPLTAKPSSKALKFVGVSLLEYIPYCYLWSRGTLNARFKCDKHISLLLNSWFYDHNMQEKVITCCKIIEWYFCKIFNLWYTTTCTTQLSEVKAPLSNKVPYFHWLCWYPQGQTDIV